MTRPLQDLSLAVAKNLCVALALPLLALSAVAAGPGLPAPESGLTPSGLGALPLYFEAASGQIAGDFPFLARGRACNFFVGPTEAVLVLSELNAPVRRAHDDRAAAADGQGRATRELRFEFVDANAAACVTGVDELPGKANYFLGHDPAQWRTGVPLFGRVRVAQIYPGVDLVFYGNQQRLEYDFVVAPKADPGRIAIRFDGADRVRVSAGGDLVFTLGRAEIRQPKPFVYQTVHGIRREIAGGYSLTARQTVTFKLGDYDRDLPLVIDPVLSYSTFYGGSGLDIGWAVSVDTNGFVYVAGETMGALLTSPGTLTNQYHGAGPQAGDAFVAKFNNAATRLVYLSYLGGSADDAGWSLTVDDQGNAYVTGYTDSTDFPTQNAIYSTIKGIPYSGLNLYPTDAFVVKLGPEGTNLVYSTYLGGDWVDFGIGIAVDQTGAAYVAGYTESTNFPTLTDSLFARTNYGGSGDAYLTKISPGGTNLVYSIYLGGTDEDSGESVAANAEGLAFVTGYTRSTNFPVYRPLQPGLAGVRDAFVTVIGTTGTNPVFSTYLGGSGDNAGRHITLDAASNYYVTGSTTEDPSFPITPSALNPGGVFRSDSGAANWTDASSGLESVVATTFAIDPQIPARVYVGTWRGVARSTDAGLNWNPSVRVLPDTNLVAPAIAVGVVLSLAIDPTTPATLYAGTATDGVYKSLDAGTNWSLSSTGLANLVVRALAVDPLAPATVYAGTDGGIFQSTNSATDWSAINNGLGNLFVRGLALHPLTPATLYAATAGGVYRSADRGAAWAAFNNGLSSLSAQAIASDPATPTTLYVGTDAGVFKTVNGGTNWSQINAGLTTSNVTALAIDPLTPATLYAGTTNGLFKSADGGTNWNLTTNGLAVTDVAALAVDPQSPTTLYAGLKGTSFFGGEDVFLLKSGTDGFSAVFGGARDDQSWDLAVDSAGQAHITGSTFSTNFPTQNTAGFLRATNAGGEDAFVAKLNANGSALVQSAYLGGSGSDAGHGIALDAVGNVYFVGETASTDFPFLGGGQIAFGGVKDAFLAKVLGDGLPTLQITSTGSEVLLSWPPYWPEFSLQITAALASTNGWSTLPMAPIQTNGALSLQLGTTNAASFFRLQRPSAGPGF